MTSAYRNYPGYYDAQSKSVAYPEITRYSDTPVRAEEKNARRVVHEEEFYESDDEPLDAEQERYYDEVAAGRSNLRGDDPYWEMKSALNRPLQKLFSNQVRKQVESKYDEESWQRPSTYGLDNSAPIIATQYNVSRGRPAICAESKATNHNSNQSSSKATATTTPQPTGNTLYTMIQSGQVNYATAQRRDRRGRIQQPPQRPSTPPQHEAWSTARSTSRTLPQSSSVPDHHQNPSRNRQGNGVRMDEDEEGEDEDEDDECEEYEDGDDDEEEDDEDVLQNLAGTTGLSANLKALLGLSSGNGAQEEDMQQMPAWTPPTHSGLNNSAPLVQKQKLR